MYARVLVEVDMSKPITQRLLIKRRDEIAREIVEFFVTVTYKTIPSFCTFCYIVGHDDIHQSERTFQGIQEGIDDLHDKEKIDNHNMQQHENNFSHLRDGVDERDRQVNNDHQGSRASTLNGLDKNHNEERMINGEAVQQGRNVAPISEIPANSNHTVQGRRNISLERQSYSVPGTQQNQNTFIVTGNSRIRSAPRDLKDYRCGELPIQQPCIVFSNSFNGRRATKSVDNSTRGKHGLSELDESSVDEM